MTIGSSPTALLKLCGTAFDPAVFRAHLQATLDIGRGFFIEFVFRDTNCLAGAMRQRVADACRIVRDLTGPRRGPSDPG